MSFQCAQNYCNEQSTSLKDLLPYKISEHHITH